MKVIIMMKSGWQHLALVEVEHYWGDPPVRRSEVNGWFHEDLIQARYYSDKCAADEAYEHAIHHCSPRCVPYVCIRQIP